MHQFLLRGAVGLCRTGHSSVLVVSALGFERPYLSGRVGTGVFRDGRSGWMYGACKVETTVPQECFGLSGTLQKTHMAPEKHLSHGPLFRFHVNFPACEATVRTVI